MADLPAQRDPELAFALRAADAAALALLYVDRDELDGDNPVANGSSSFGEAQIHQATGMVSVQLGASVEEALLLRLRFSAEEDE